jgi:hypothetical protein
MKYKSKQQAVQYIQFLSCSQRVETLTSERIIEVEGRFSEIEKGNKNLNVSVCGEILLLAVVRPQLFSWIFTENCKINQLLMIFFI